MKPRRAQEDHSHPDLDAAVGAGFDPTKDVFRTTGFGSTNSLSWHSSAATSGSWSNTTLLTGGYAKDCHYHSSTAVGYREMATFLYPGREFEARIGFGVASNPVATSYMFIGMYGSGRPAAATWGSTCEYSIGVRLNGTAGYWEWCEAVAAASGTSTASTVPVVNGNLVRLTLVGAGAGAVSGTLTDLQTGASDTHTYSSAALLTAWHLLIVTGSSSGGALGKCVEGFACREKLRTV